MPAHASTPAAQARLCARAGACLWRSPLLLASLILLVVAWIVPAVGAEHIVSGRVVAT